MIVNALSISSLETLRWGRKRILRSPQPIINNLLCKALCMNSFLDSLVAKSKAQRSPSPLALES